MDDYLEMLMDSSSNSAKAALIVAMLPVEKKTDASRDLRTQLSAEELDEMVAMCSTMDARSLTITARVMDMATGRSEPWAGFRRRALYGAAVAPLLDAFRPDQIAHEINVHDVVKQLTARTKLGQTPTETALADELAIARGLCIKLLASGVSSVSSTTDNELLWLGNNHIAITPLAAELKERRTSDALLIADMIKDANKPLIGGVL